MKAGDYRDVALEAKDSAIGVWQARYMDISRQHDDATAEVVRLAAKLRVEEKARRFFQAKIEAALALHTEFGIYDECGHDHTEEDVRTGKAIDVEDVGFTCEEGKIQSVCRHCHLWNDESYERTEDGEWPCPTVKALRGE